MHLVEGALVFIGAELMYERKIFTVVLEKGENHVE